MLPYTYRVQLMNKENVREARGSIFLLQGVAGRGRRKKFGVGQGREQNPPPIFLVEIARSFLKNCPLKVSAIASDNCYNLFTLVANCWPYFKA